MRIGEEVEERAGETGNRGMEGGHILRAEMGHQGATALATKKWKNSPEKTHLKC